MDSSHVAITLSDNGQNRNVFSLLKIAELFVLAVPAGWHCRGTAGAGYAYMVELN